MSSLSVSPFLILLFDLFIYIYINVSVDVYCVNIAHEINYSKVIEI